MRQRCWMELLKNYDCKILYHSGKPNFVANTLSQRRAFMAMIMVHEWELLEHMSELTITPNEKKLLIFCAYVKVRPELIDWIQERQGDDKLLAKILGDMERFTPLGYNQWDNGLLLYRDWICVPDDEDLRQGFLTKAHGA